MPALRVQTPYAVYRKTLPTPAYSGAGRRRRLKLSERNSLARAGRWRMPLRRKTTSSSDTYGEVDSTDELCCPDLGETRCAANV